MASQGVIVRRLAAIENFGSMNVLCTDKTGTLTLGVVKLDGAFDVEGEPSTAVLHYAYLNASLQTGLANPLDEAIIALAQETAEQPVKIDEIPYDFVRKRLTVVVKDQVLPGMAPGEALMVTKGALESVLSVCESCLAKDQIIHLDDQKQEMIENKLQQWSADGYRVLGVAIKPVLHQEVYERENETGMIFAGFLIFFDPPKSGVKEVVADLAHLGVKLKVITGDNRLVAAHTMRSIGLETTQILTGKEIQEMNDEALWHAVQKTNVFAEVDPNQKDKIILALQKMGDVVGYMGDGVNDAPALHSADVGISVDNAVDVAKEAADFILLKQDLAVLKQGVIQGRKTFANTLKYIFMATSANFGNMFSVAGASLLVPFLPLLPKQILLINLLTDLPEMTIAQDNVDETLVQQPHKWDIQFIRRFMFVFGPLSSLFDFATFATLLYLIKANEDLFRTGWFVESVLSAAVVVLSLRTRQFMLRNRPARPMLLATGLVALLAVGLPYTPLARLLGLTPLPLHLLVIIFLIIIAYLVSAEVAKRIFYRRFRLL
jgi:Mg2+-importing ATPase